MDSFIIQHVRLFDGESVTEDASVLVRDGLIAEIGHNIEAPDLPTLSTPGHTLVPGLIDAHCHLFQEAKLAEQAFRFGITTLMDLHNLHENVVQLKKWANERRDFPDIKSSHFSATIENGWPIWIEKKLGLHETTNFDNWPNVKNEEDAEPFVDRAIADGADYIKLMHESGKAIGVEAGSINQPREAVQAAIVHAAHKRGLKVIAHAWSIKDTLEVLRAGVDGLAHASFDAPITPEIINLYKQNKAWLNPTLANIGGPISGDAMEIMERFSRDERVKSRVANQDVTSLNQCHHLAAPGARWEYAVDSVRRLKEEGIEIICGSDAAPGMAIGAYLHIELYLLVTRAGLSPLEALKVATSATAKCFEFIDRGRIAPGLKADLLLVEGDPTKDITDLLNIKGIWREGIRFKGHPGFPQE